ncbi:hypothetical protein ACFL1H_07075, partial [Nanoarchaeota archaeon]
MNRNLNNFFLILILVILSSILAIAWDDCPDGLVNDAYPGSCAKYIDTNDDGICDLSQTNQVEDEIITDVSFALEHNCEQHLEEGIVSVMDHEPCADFVDLDGNGVCDSEDKEDHSDDPYHDLITGKELKTKTVEYVAGIYEIDVDLFAKELSDKLGVDVNGLTHFQILHDDIGLKPSVAKEIATSIKISGFDVLDDNVLVAERPSVNTQVNQKSIFDGKYPFIQTVLIMLILYIISVVLYKKKVMSMIVHRKIWN